jgi:hypothetical protein
MPVPIRSIQDKGVEKDCAMDYSFLFNALEKTNTKKVILASNKDADLLYQIWLKSEKKDDGYFKTDSQIDHNDILRLKANGFLDGDYENIKFTKKGKTVITTMALAEQNNFIKNKQKKDYSEILASMDKRGKPGYRIPKYASNNSNSLNLKKNT